MNHSTIANRWNADLVDEKYEIWRTGPENLDEEWRAFFEGFALGSEDHFRVRHRQRRTQRSGQ